MGKKEDLRAAKRAAKAKLSPSTARDRARAAQRASKPAKLSPSTARDRARAAQRASKPPPKPKDRQARDRARAAQRASKPPPKAKDQRRNSARALQRAKDLAQQLAQVLPTSSVATPAITPTAAAATAPPSITSPWQLGNKVVTFPATRPALLSFSRLESLQLILPRCGSKTRLTPPSVNPSRSY